MTPLVAVVPIRGLSKTRRSVAAVRLGPLAHPYRCHDATREGEEFRSEWHVNSEAEECTRTAVVGGREEEDGWTADP